MATHTVTPGLHRLMGRILQEQRLRAPNKNKQYTKTDPSPAMVYQKDV